jgi:purine-binding chemotaxis protein CheW
MKKGGVSSGPGAAIRKREGRTAVRRAEGRAGRPRTEYLAFRLAGDVYAVQIARISEILKPPPMTEVPRAHPSIIGIVSVRGRLVTVVDLRRRFRLPEGHIDGRTRILLIEREDEQIGLLVDEVLQVYRLADSEIEPANVLGGDQPAHIIGIGRPEEGGVIVLVDLMSVLEG